MRLPVVTILQIHSHCRYLLRQRAIHRHGPSLQALQTAAPGVHDGTFTFRAFGIRYRCYNCPLSTPSTCRCLTPLCPYTLLLLHQEITSLTLTSVFLAVIDALFRAGWLHSAINAATRNNPTARSDGRTALNTIFLAVFMNVLCIAPPLPSSPPPLPSPHPVRFLVPPNPLSRSAYTLFFLDRDRINSFPRRLQHPFSLPFWRLGMASFGVLMGCTSHADAFKTLES
jgi:hypothetical protein